MAEPQVLQANVSNISTISEPVSEMKDFKIATTTIFTLFFLISVFGNSFIAGIIVTDDRLKSTTNILIGNMAISDLLSTLLIIPLTISKILFGSQWFVRGTTGLVLCKFLNFFPDVSTSVSFYSCLFIAVDRYLAVAYPLRGGFSRSRLKYIIPGIWVFSALIVSPYFYHFKLVNFKDTSFCVIVDQFVFQTHYYILLALNLGIPLPIITTLYILIVYKLYRHKVPGNQTDISKNMRERQKQKVLKMAMTIVCLQYISWGYFGVVYTLFMAGKIDEHYWKHLSLVGISLAYLSYNYNFFIYLIFNDIYRARFKSLTLKLCCRVKVEPRAATTSFTLSHLGRLRASPNGMGRSNPGLTSLGLMK